MPSAQKDFQKIDEFINAYKDFKNEFSSLNRVRTLSDTTKISIINGLNENYNKDR